MLADHANKSVLHGSAPWLSYLGRFAFPFFAVAFAYNVVHHLRRPQRFLTLAITFGALAQWPYMALFDASSGNVTALNILFVFAFAWGIDWLLSSASRESGLFDRLPAMGMALCLFLLGGWALSPSSYSWQGLALVLTLIGLFRRGGMAYTALAAISLLFSLGSMNIMGLPVLVGLLAFSSYGRLAWRLNRFLPGMALYVGYTLHLWVLYGVMAIRPA